MTGTTLASSKVKERLDHVLERFAARVREGVPSVRYSIQHGQNDNFPWWVVARFVNGTSADKVVDVSVDCRATPEGWLIQADIAREDGMVLEDLPPVHYASSANGSREEGQMEDDGNRLEAFLMQHVRRVITELA